jgi:hypothetical protein
MSTIILQGRKPEGSFLMFQPVLSAVTYNKDFGISQEEYQQKCESGMIPVRLDFHVHRADWSELSTHLLRMKHIPSPELWGLPSQWVNLESSDDSFTPEGWIVNLASDQKIDTNGRKLVAIRMTYSSEDSFQYFIGDLCEDYTPPEGTVTILKWFSIGDDGRLVLDGYPNYRAREIVPGITVRVGGTQVHQTDGIVFRQDVPEGTNITVSGDTIIIDRIGGQEDVS